MYKRQRIGLTMFISANVAVLYEPHCSALAYAAIAIACIGAIVFVVE